ncbi:Ubiquitin-40S ribosomal protein S27a [Atta colombica]|uniref:Ubiquitin-40S ribosomal protein S27a n=1 Tax=Atta colombica TaxID=520822 RepID=A0A195B3T0_9HYME|nr:Ubiquitin-40S ribosomal protein S27a [Atta colombica]
MNSDHFSIFVIINSMARFVNFFFALYCLSFFPEQLFHSIVHTWWGANPNLLLSIYRFIIRTSFKYASLIFALNNNQALINLPLNTSLKSFQSGPSRSAATSGSFSYLHNYFPTFLLCLFFCTCGLIKAKCLSRPLSRRFRTPFVDENGKIHRLRRECPMEQCGAGVFMAAMEDRHYCGKCAYTLVFNKPEEK